jgi:hypothetical protein
MTTPVLMPSSLVPFLVLIDPGSVPPGVEPGLVVQW